MCAFGRVYQKEEIVLKYVSCDIANSYKKFGEYNFTGADGLT